ncbi:MAG: hypothetical protein M9944_17455 [Rhizobiaceae bacterium]|nr:hypothetical protein [Rhizobiaceae bacterium]
MACPECAWAMFAGQIDRDRLAEQDPMEPMRRLREVAAHILAEPSVGAW